MKRKAFPTSSEKLRKKNFKIMKKKHNPIDSVQTLSHQPTLRQNFHIHGRINEKPRIYSRSA